jgi:hypothetical protein
MAAVKKHEKRSKQQARALAVQPAASLDEKPKSAMQLAGAVAAEIRLQDLRLLEADLKCVKVVDADELKFNIAIEGKQKSDTLFVHAQFSVAIEGQASRIGATYLAVYKVTTEKIFEDANVQAFAQMNGLLHIWPYWREFVQSSAQRLGLPPITLPVVRPTAIAGDGKFQISMKKESIAVVVPPKLNSKST